MDLMEQLMAELGKLPEGVNDETKNGIKTLFQEVNKKAGKNATDLETYKKGHTEFQKLTKKLTEAGIDPDKFDSIAEELGVKKTLQDDLEVTKVANKELANKLKEASKQLERMKIENVLAPKVKELAQSFTTADGTKHRIADKFIDKNELYKSLDLDNDVLVQDRVTKVLSSALADQQAFIKELGGPDGLPLHKVMVGETQPGASKGVIDTTQVQGIIKQHQGSKDAIASVLTMYEQAAKPK